MDPLTPLVRELVARSIRFVVIGVAGINHYARSPATIFTTEDRDLFLPSEPDNLEQTWHACEAVGLELWTGEEPLDSPRDDWLAARVIERRGTVKATDRRDLHVDLSLVMAGFDFETVWRERRVFIIDDVGVPVARLLHIVKSKHAAGRDKDRLFLATYREALGELLKRDTPEGPDS